MKKISRKKFIALSAFAIFATTMLWEKFSSKEKTVVCTKKIPYFPGKIKKNSDFSKPGIHLAG